MGAEPIVTDCPVLGVEPGATRLNQLAILPAGIAEAPPDLVERTRRRVPRD